MYEHLRQQPQPVSVDDRELAHRVGMSVRQVQRALAVLRADGRVSSRLEKRNYGGGWINRRFLEVSGG